MPRGTKITLLIPTMNELEGMKRIMPRVKSEWVDEILVVDSSDDGTYEYALQQGYRVIKQRSKGLASAYRDAVAVATGDVIISFSPDGNCVPERIPDLIRKMEEGYDMVIVSRYLDTAKSEDDDWVTAFGNWMFTRMINVLFSGNYTDTLGIFRAWRKELFQHVRFKTERSGPEPHLCILCAKQKLRVAEIPGDEPPRIGGTRKMNPLVNGAVVLLTILNELFSNH